jgi:hypothetical protein
LQLCTIIPQRPYYIYLGEASKEGLRTKVKMAIISMLRTTFAKVTKLVILIKEEMPSRKKSIAKYH